MRLGCARHHHFHTGDVNLSETGTEESRSSRVPKTVFLLMLIIVVGLAMVSVFANFKRPQQGESETVAVRPAVSLTPSEQRR
jgi:hypothetical protein